MKLYPSGNCSRMRYCALNSSGPGRVWCPPWIKTIRDGAREVARSGRRRRQQVSQAVTAESLYVGQFRPRDEMAGTWMAGILVTPCFTSFTSHPSKVGNSIQKRPAPLPHPTQSSFGPAADASKATRPAFLSRIGLHGITQTYRNSTQKYFFGIK